MTEVSHQIETEEKIGWAAAATDLLVEVDGPVAERDAVAEAVLARGPAKLPIQPDVLPLGVRMEAGRVHASIEHRHRRRGPPVHGATIVGQGVVLPADHCRPWLQGRVCRYRDPRCR